MECKATLVIPAGWNDSLENGDPKPLLLYLDDSDMNTADAVEGSCATEPRRFSSETARPHD